MQLPWAFRGDIDHMDSLKTLPVAPLALAAGELAGGVLVLAVIQFVVLAALLAAGGNPAVIMTAAAFLVPFDVLMLGVSNLLFLIYPVRLVQTNAADFQLMGRMMLLMLLQFLILIPSLGIPAAIGGDRLLAERLLLAGVRRHLVARARGRIAADFDPAGVGIRAVRSQHGDAGMRPSATGSRRFEFAVEHGALAAARRGVA